MSNTSNNLMPNLLPTAENGQPLVRIGSAAAVAAIAPHLLGFRPKESLVLTFFDSDARVQLASRMDLPIGEGTEREVTADLFDLAAESCWRAVHIAVVSDSPAVPLALIKELGLLASESCLDILGCGLVRSQHWYSVGPGGQLAPDGESLSDGSALAATSQLVLAGRSFLADREAFAAQVQGTEPQADEVARILADPTAGWVTISEPGRKFSRARLRAEDAIVQYLTGVRERPDPATAAHWIAGFSDSRIREAVLWRLSPAAPSHTVGANQDAASEALAWLCRTAPTAWRAPVASSLAALAWQSGDGVLAGVAADYALECDPTNRLADLVRLALDRGAPATIWIDLMRSMTLAELRASAAGSRVRFAQKAGMASAVSAPPGVAARATG